MSTGRTEAERIASLEDNMRAYIIARVALSQREIDIQLDLLRAGDQSALGKLLREFDSILGSDYHWQMEVTQKAYERLKRYGLVMREGISDGSTHYFLETRGTEGEKVIVDRRAGPLGFSLTRIIHEGRTGSAGGLLGVGEVSGIKIVENPQAATKAEIPPTS